MQKLIKRKLDELTALIERLQGDERRTAVLFCILTLLSDDTVDALGTLELAKDYILHEETQPSRTPYIS